MMMKDAYFSSVIECVKLGQIFYNRDFMGKKSKIFLQIVSVVTFSDPYFTVMKFTGTLSPKM